MDDKINKLIIDKAKSLINGLIKADYHVETSFYVYFQEKEITLTPKPSNQRVNAS